MAPIFGTSVDFGARWIDNTVGPAARSGRIFRGGLIRMSSVRVLVGTRKGAFVLESDGKRSKWNISGPHFGGWELYHVKASLSRIRIACMHRSPAVGSGR